MLQGGLFGVILRWTDARLRDVRFVGKVITSLSKFNDAVALVGHNRAALIRSFAYSTVFNLILIFIHVVLSLALGLSVPILAYALIVPLTSIMLLIPSIQGLGVRDWSLVVLVGVFTPNTEAVAAMAAAIILHNLISGIIGMVLYGAYTVGKSRRGTAQHTLE